MKVALLAVLGLALGALGGAALGIGAGLTWIGLAKTSGLDSGTLVFFTFMPLGAATTIEMLHNASDLWRMEGFAWATCEQLLPLCCVSCAHLCVSQGGVL